MPSEAISVLCVDDNDLVAEAVRLKLEGVGGFKWLGRLASATGLVEETARLKPDVVLLDIDMAGSDPFEALRRLKSASPNSRVLMFTGYVDRDLVDRAVEAGAWGYLAKSQSPQQLVDAIQRVAKGEFVLQAESQFN